ncbi:hypothetical protein KSP40_PGU020011 [Platanthera guangdongensis]|uniref:Uncharacterized protein n=1 Tax=Platanthera guangdongensis TaxID=2320717 RepID=A0ABR2LX04_9ASPA
MKETVSSYRDLVHWVEAQIDVDEAIKTHYQQFEGSHKRRTGQEKAPSGQEDRRNEERRNGER